MDSPCPVPGVVFRFQGVCRSLQKVVWELCYHLGMLASAERAVSPSGPQLHVHVAPAEPSFCPSPPTAFSRCRILSLPPFPSFLPSLHPSRPTASPCLRTSLRWSQGECWEASGGLVQLHTPQSHPVTGSPRKAEPQGWRGHKVALYQRSSLSTHSSIPLQNRSHK